MHFEVLHSSVSVMSTSCKILFEMNQNGHLYAAIHLRIKVLQCDS